MNKENKKYLTPPRIVLHTKRAYIVAFILFVMSAMFLPWSIYTMGSGRITAVDPNERIQEITAPVQGFVRKWHVREGSQVRKGEIIVEMIDNDPGFLDRIELEREAALAAVESARQAFETAKVNLERQKSLFEQGLTSRKEYEKARIDSSKLSVDLSTARASLLKAETQVSRQSSQKVVAPRDGTVLRVLLGEGNQLIKQGDALLVFAPQLTSIAAELWIPGNDVRFVQKGQTARVQFEGWPAVQLAGWPSLAIGTFKGQVQLVDYASSFQGKFRVLIIPAEPWPSFNFLRLNANARGVISLGDTLVGIEAWRRLNDFPPATEPVQDELNKMLKAKKAQDESKGLTEQKEAQDK